jgi:RHS repeat-associated protein
MSIHRFVNLLLVLSLLAAQGCVCNSTPTITPTVTATTIVTKTPTVTETPLPDEVYDLDAPPLDTTVATDLCTATQFLYTGADPLQTNVVPGTIECQHVSVLRGYVLNRENSPLSGVAISILNHPEFGQTQSREDGMFDMAVNGGGQLTVNYNKDGYLPSQRKVQTPWQEYAWLPDVVLVEPDSAHTVDLGQTDQAMLMVQGKQEEDKDGIRQATLLLPKGTTASMKMPTGNSTPLATMDVRITEFTVGDNGPQAMPAELPPNVGYTYAVDFSADEATEANAADVEFSQPVYHYVENYIGFPVGSDVPVAYYDREKGQWIPADNGRVIKILAITDGLADLDTDGDGNVDNGMGPRSLDITTAERQSLAGLYQPGQSLWRVPVKHFSTYDCNWPYGCPDENGDGEGDCVAPEEQPDLYDPEDNVCESKDNSVIECQNQILGEKIPIVGTSLTLNYRSDRVPGFKASYTVKIPLTGDRVPTTLKSILLTIRVAGQEKKYAFSPEGPRQVKIFTWDGLDAYGRTVQGRQKIEIGIGYVYEAVYLGLRPGSKFGDAGIGVEASRPNLQIILWRWWDEKIGIWDARPQGLGGWTADVHHAYNPSARILSFGDGRRQVISDTGSIIQTAAGDGPITTNMGDGGPASDATLASPRKVTFFPDGGYLIPTHNVIRFVNAEGIISTVAGVMYGTVNFGGDGGSATQAYFYEPSAVAVDRDGNLYIADRGNGRIRRVGTDGIINTVAGGGKSLDDGVLATEAQLGGLWDVVVGPEGDLYVTTGDRVRRIGKDSVITTVVGIKYGAGYSGDGGPAIEAAIRSPHGIAFAPDGSLYIADTGNHVIRRIGPDGIITTVVGSPSAVAGAPGAKGFSGDGNPAINATLNQPFDVAVDSDGGIYIADNLNNRVRYVGTDGIITTVVGNGVFTRGGDNGPATQAPLQGVVAVSIAPDGTLYLSENSHSVVRRIRPAMPGLSIADVMIPSEDGSELYHFASNGRHLETLNTLTGAVLYKFDYDDNTGLLKTVMDGDGNVTTIDRDADGNPVAIVGPYGQRTILTLDANGFLSTITNPAGETERFAYSTNGLMQTHTDPRGSIFTYTYDETPGNTQGLLTKATDPVGGFRTLTRSKLQRTKDRLAGYEVIAKTAMGYVTTYRVELLNNCEKLFTNIFPDGTSNELTIYPDGTRTIKYADGTVVTQVQGPDPRWGMLAPVTTSITIAMPSGLQSVINTTRTVTLNNENNPLSLATLEEIVSLNGRDYKSVYDAATHTFTSTTPEGRQWNTTINDQGRITKEQVAGLEPITYTYEKGQLKLVAQSSGTDARTLTLEYYTEGESNGYLSKVTDSLGRASSFTYDAAGRLLQQTLPGERVIKFGYDTNGNLKSLTPPDSKQHDFAYNPVNLLASYTPPEVEGITNTQTKYGYYPDRLLQQITRPDGKTLSLSYVAGQLKTLITPHGQLTYNYNSTTGHLDSIDFSTGANLSFGYDGWLPTQTTWSGAVSGSVTRSYDADLRLAGLSVNDGESIASQYDGDSLLTQIGDLTLNYDTQNGFLKGTTLGGVTDTWSYNSFGEPSGYSAAYNNSSLFAVMYTRDTLGRISQKVETIAGEAHTFEYKYYTEGWLWQVWKDGELVSEYKYDANGNRLSFAGSGETFVGKYDAQDRLNPYGDTTYTYTDNGELLTKTTNGQTTTYDYDELGNLRLVSLPDGTKIEYMVDGLNRRVGKKVNGTLVQGFLYQDSLKPVAELDGAGNVVSRFVYGERINVPEYIVKDGQTYRLVLDHLGSPRLVVNVNTGEIAQRMDYDEFGNVINDTNPGFQPFGFAGGLYDVQTGLMRFGARDYEAIVGRWTTKDPILFWGSDLNLFVYSSNRPIDYTDPLGLDGIKVTCVGPVCIKVNWCSGGLPPYQDVRKYDQQNQPNPEGYFDKSSKSEKPKQYKDWKDILKPEPLPLKDFDFPVIYKKLDLPEKK